MLLSMPQPPPLEKKTSPAYIIALNIAGVNSRVIGWMEVCPPIFILGAMDIFPRHTFPDDHGIVETRVEVDHVQQITHHAKHPIK